MTGKLNYDDSLVAELMMGLNRIMSGQQRKSFESHWCSFWRCRFGKHYQHWLMDGGGVWSEKTLTPLSVEEDGEGQR